MAKTPRPDRQRMPEQSGETRRANFLEVNLGLTEELAQTEASRCLLCKKPKCVDGCPVGIDIPGFLKAVAEGSLEDAARILYEGNVMPCITGRVCPQEEQCEKDCVLAKKGDAVGIGNVERFVADWAAKNVQQTPKLPDATGKRVAIVGSGPAGITCAAELRRFGHAATVFEALHEPGGVLRYGIPEFRLPQCVIDQELQALDRLGVQVMCNMIIGKTFTIEQLLGELCYHAVFIANGAGGPTFQGIPGEELNGVYSANEYLTRVNLMEAASRNSATPVLRHSDVVVVGGGNTAMDAVRVAKRIGAENATLVYRRSREEMPARAEEVEHAENEGINFEFLTNPVEVLDNDSGWVTALRCRRMKLGEPDDSGRRRPVPIPDSEFEIPCGVFIEAIGTKANPLLTAATPGLETNDWGNVVVDEQGMTSLPGVFAGGDIVRGAATVILAMGDGKKTASSIDAYLKTL